MSLWKSLGLQDHTSRRLVGEEEREDRVRQTQTEMEQAQTIQTTPLL